MSTYHVHLPRIYEEDIWHSDPEDCCPNCRETRDGYYTGRDCLSCGWSDESDIWAEVLAEELDDA